MSAPTQTNRDAYRIAGKLFVDVLATLHELDRDLQAFEDEVEAAGAPWTPGRLPRWKPEPID